MELAITILISVLSLLISTVVSFYLSSPFRESAAKRKNSLRFKIIDKIDHLLEFKVEQITKKKNTINVLKDKNKRLSIKKEGKEIVSIYPSYWITININPTGSKTGAKTFFYLIFGLGMLSINFFGFALNSLIGGSSHIPLIVFPLLSIAYLFYFQMNDNSIWWDISGILSNNSKLMLNISEDQIFIQSWWNKKFLKINAIDALSFKDASSKFETKLACIVNEKEHTLFKYPSILNKSLLTPEQVSEIKNELNIVLKSRT